MTSWSILWQERNSKNERDLRALKKRLDKYQSAKDAICDPFFSELLIMAWVSSGGSRRGGGETGKEKMVFV